MSSRNESAFYSGARLKEEPDSDERTGNAGSNTKKRKNLKSEEPPRARVKVEANVVKEERPDSPSSMPEEPPRVKVEADEDRPDSASATTALHRAVTLESETEVPSRVPLAKIKVEDDYQPPEEEMPQSPRLSSSLGTGEDTDQSCTTIPSALSPLAKIKAERVENNDASSDCDHSSLEGPNSIDGDMKQDRTSSIEELLQPVIERQVGRILKAIESVNKGNEGTPRPYETSSTDFDLKELEKPLLQTTGMTMLEFKKYVQRRVRKDQRLHFELIGCFLVYWKAPKPVICVPQQQIDDKLQPFVDKHVKDILTEIKKVNHGKEGSPVPVEEYFDHRWKKGGKELSGSIGFKYLQQVKKCVRNDPRLHFELIEGSIFYWKAPKHPNAHAPQLQENDNNDYVKGVINQQVERALTFIEIINEDNHRDPKPLVEFTIIYKRSHKKVSESGMNLREFTKRVLKGVRCDPRLVVEVNNGDLLYWKAPKSRGTRSMQPVPPSHVTDAALKPAAPVQLDSKEARESQDTTRPYQAQSAELLPTTVAVTPTASRLVVSSSDSRPFRTSFCSSNLLADQMMARSFQQASVLGFLQENLGESSRNPEHYRSGPHEKEVFMNMHAPFCLATIGLPGTGKSHTLACTLENCLLAVKREGIQPLMKPMTSLVLHYDQNPLSMCEAVGLLTPSQATNKGLFEHDARCVPASKAIVLASPTYYMQRKAFYGDRCSVRPLLFKWASLTVDHVKRIMGIESNATQLDVPILALLRRYQSQAKLPCLSRFVKEIRDICDRRGQQGVMEQRIALLELVVAESDTNKAIIHEGMDISDTIHAGFDLVMADLSDPLLPKDEANCLFQIVAEQFRSIHVEGGKVLALENSHMYMSSDESDGLSRTIVEIGRAMLREDMRLVISTLNPMSLAPGLLDLVSVAVLHRFRRADWWDYLRRKLSLNEIGLKYVQSLLPGEALVFSSRADECLESEDGSHLLRLRIRPRITTDLKVSASPCDDL